LFATGQLLLSIYTYEGMVFFAALISTLALKLNRVGLRLLTTLRVILLAREVFSRERIVVWFVIIRAKELSSLFFRNRFFEAAF
jgi:hypothetical protein